MIVQRLTLCVIAIATSSPALTLNEPAYDNNANWAPLRLVGSTTTDFKAEKDEDCTGGIYSLSTLYCARSWGKPAFVSTLHYQTLRYEPCKDGIYSLSTFYCPPAKTGALHRGSPQSEVKTLDQCSTGGHRRTLDCEGATSKPDAGRPFTQSWAVHVNLSSGDAVRMRPPFQTKRPVAEKPSVAEVKPSSVSLAGSPALQQIAGSALILGANLHNAGETTLVLRTPMIVGTRLPLDQTFWLRAD